MAKTKRAKRKSGGVRQGALRPNGVRVMAKTPDYCKKMRRAARALNDAIMRDQGGFGLETLHALNALCRVARLPDYVGVKAVTGWTICGEGEENVRFFGAGAHGDAANN